MSAYSFCSKCGNALAPEDAFCGECGNRAESSTPPTTAPPTPIGVEASVGDYPTTRRPVGDPNATVPPAAVQYTPAPTEATRFEAAAVLDEAWRSTRQHYARWLGVLIVAFLVPLVISLISVWIVNAAISDLGSSYGLDMAEAFAYGSDYGMSAVDKFVLLLGLLVSLAGSLAFFYVWLGLIRNAYAVASGGRPEIMRLVRWERFGWFLVSAVIYFGIVFLLSFPLPFLGLGIAAVLGLFGYALVAQPDINGFAALGSSWDRVTRHFWGFVGLKIVLLGVPVAIFGLGLFTLQFGLVGVLTGQDALMLLIALLMLVALMLALVFAIAFAITGDAIAYRRLYSPDAPTSPLR